MTKSKSHSDSDSGSYSYYSYSLYYSESDSEKSLHSNKPTPKPFNLHDFLRAKRGNNVKFAKKTKPDINLRVKKIISVKEDEDLDYISLNLNPTSSPKLFNLHDFLRAKRGNNVKFAKKTQPDSNLRIKKFIEKELDPILFNPARCCCIQCRDLLKARITDFKYAIKTEPNNTEYQVMVLEESQGSCEVPVHDDLPGDDECDSAYRTATDR